MYVDKKLGGIQAVQTLSRLNRAHPGKDTTYILDFQNDTGDILQAFRTYYETAALEATTDPNLVLDLRAKLDAAGHYDDYEVERVAKVELDPQAKQSQLVAAIQPVADRLLKRYKAAAQSLAAAEAAGQSQAAAEAKDTLDALVLFKGDMGAFNRLYAFLSQMFDYGNTDIEKRFLFYRRLLPLLEFGRERDTVDLSKVARTHDTVRSAGKQALALAGGGSYARAPMDAVGSGRIQEKEQAYLAEIIERVNGLFEGQIRDEDQLQYVDGALKGKLLQNDTLAKQAADNSKEQFANSPDLNQALVNAIIDALDVHNTLSSQALGSTRVQQGLKEILLGPGQLYELLRSGHGRGGAPAFR